MQEGRGNVRVWIADPHQTTLDHLTQALGAAGWQAAGHKSVKDLRTALRGLAQGDPGPDVLVLAGPEDDNGVREFCQALRLGKERAHPLTLLVLCTAHANAGAKRDLLGQGADAVLFKPFSANDVAEVMIELLQQNRGFAATADRIGPVVEDLEVSEAEHTDDDPIVAVPNTMGRRMAQDPTLDRDMRLAWDAVQHKRVKANVVSVLARFQIAFGNLPDHGVTKDALLQIVNIAAECESRTLDGVFAGAREIFGSMKDYAGKLVFKDPPDFSQREIDVGKALCEAMRAAIIPHVSTERLAKLIRVEVNAWLDKKIQLPDYRSEDLVLHDTLLDYRGS